MDRGVWLATVHGVQSQTQLIMHACIYIYIYTHILFNTLFHYGLSQGIEQFPVLCSRTLLFISLEHVYHPKEIPYPSPSLAVTLALDNPYPTLSL